MTDKLPCKITRETWVDEIMSKKEDRAVYREDDVIEFFMPNGTSCASRLKNLTDLQRSVYRTEIENYKNGVSELDEGTPLEKVPGIKKSIAKELEYLNIKTAEQMANAPDSVLQKMMGGVALREKCKEFLLKNKDEALSNRITKENEELKKQIEDLRSLVEAKTAPVEEVVVEPLVEAEEPKKKRLGIF